MRTKNTILLCALLAVSFACFAACSKAQPTETTKDREYLSISESVELGKVQDQWSLDVMLDAFSKLADNGDIDPVPEECSSLNDALSFRKEGDGYVIDIKNPDVERKLTKPFTTEMDKIIIRTTLGVADRKSTAGRTQSNTFPWFYPNITDDPSFKFNSCNQVFADTMEECKYLIYMGTLDTFVEEDFYWGKVSRITRTTVVMVFDAQARELLHIRYIGTDTPPETDAEFNAGLEFMTEKYAYVRSLIVSE